MFFTGGETVVVEHNSSEQAIPFTVVSDVGAGSYGTCYKAYDATQQRVVALKVLQCNAASCAELFEAAAAVAALKHPGIASVDAMGSAESQSYIATEWVEGKNLAAYLAENRYDLIERLAIAKQIASAMSYAHQAGVLHRALKPSNVLLSGDHQVKLVDFGMGSRELSVLRAVLTDQPLEANAGLDVTQTTALQNSVGWLAPELLQGEAASTASEVFSFGVLLYELCYQQHPFAANDAIATAAAVTEGMTRPAPAWAQTQVPAPVQRLIRQCLSVSPELRPDSMQLLVEQLERSIRKLNKPQPHRVLWYQQPMVLGLVLCALIPLLWFGYGSLNKRTLLAEGKVLAVMPFHVVSDDPELTLLGRGLGFSLSYDLAALQQNHGAKWVVPPVELRRYQDLTVVQLHQYFGAERILLGSMQWEEPSQQLALELALLDAKDGQRIRTKELALSATDWASNSIRLRQAASDLLGTKTAASATTLATEIVQEEEVYRSYLLGLGYMYRDNSAPSLLAGIEALEQAIALQPDFPAAEVALIRASLWVAPRDTLHRLERVQHTLNSLQLRYPTDPHLPVLFGQLAVQQSDFDEAITMFHQVLQREPNQTEAYFGLADTYRRQGRLELAEQAFLNALEQHHSWFVLNYLATFYLQTSQLDKAEQAYRKLSEWAPENASVWGMLGAIQFNRAQYSEAHYAFLQALKLSPVASNYSNVATALFYQYKYEEAVQAFQQAVELDPANYLLWANLADSYRHSQQQSLAEQAYQQAIKLLRERLELAPNNTLLQLRLAVYLAKVGDCERSEQIMLGLPDLPDSRQFVLAAQQAVVCGNNERAKRWLQQALDSGYPLVSLLNEPEFSELGLK
ncbi:protein kinase [Alkalimonas sp. NCh-2]|uniref:protein kinase domain-containing protein n=1 Tax=Alkalimonas sp. NCh-2 TaxID=3144846 RepID=UPI0031F65741